MAQRLYSILLMCKELGAKLATENYASLKPNPIAVELGLEDGGGPADVLKLAQAAFNSAGDAHANVVYAYTLDALDKVFAGDMDPATFEEHMRWFFGDSVRNSGLGVCGVRADGRGKRPTTCSGRRRWCSR
jgi:paired amphipathic helix protein Sin3a